MAGVVQYEEDEDHEENEHAVKVNMEGDAHVDILVCVVLVLSPRNLTDDPSN